MWGYYYSGYEYMVNSYVNCLCVKFDKVFLYSKLVEMVWGVGYKFNLVSVLFIEMVLFYSV